jgi:hypothetical protein
MIGEPEPERTATTEGDCETIDYAFSFVIVLKQSSIDERRMRALVDDELRRLAMTIAQSIT